MMDWKLKDLLEEFKAVEEALKIVESNDLLKRYRGFVASKIYEYVIEKMKGTNHELKSRWN